MANVRSTEGPQILGVLLSAGKIVRPHKVFVPQVILTKIHIIGVYLANDVPVPAEEFVKVPQQKSAQDVDATVFKLHQADRAARSPRSMIALGPAGNGWCGQFAPALP